MSSALPMWLSEVAGLLSGRPELFVLALVVSITGFAARVYVNRKRLAYKVEFNSKIGIVPPFDPNAGPAGRIGPGDGAGGATDLLRAFNSVSLVLIRIQNTGRVPITPEDYEAPMRFAVPHGTRYIVDFRVSASVPDEMFVRETDGAPKDELDEKWYVSDRTDDGSSARTRLSRRILRERIPDALLFDAPIDRSAPELPDDVGPGHGRRASSVNPHSRRQLTIPPVPLGPGHQFDVVIVLRSDDLHANEPPPKDKEFAPALRRPSKTVDRNRPVGRPSGTVLWAAAAAVIALLWGGSVLLAPQQPGYCAAGELRVVGSSAFAPTARRVAAQYREACPDAELPATASGSLEGLREVRDAPPGGVLAFSDGAATGPTTDLERRPAAVLIFAVVVNRGVGLEGLTAEQIRLIDSGAARSWADLGGADVPIRIVGRGPDSGSRQSYERTVLGRQETPVSSNSCLAVDRVPPGPNPAIRCERPSTQSVLEEVGRTPGAIGYADAAPAAGFDGVVRLRLDGREPTAEYLAEGYEFWTIEYAYFRGVPTGGGLLERYLGYLSDDAAARVFREDAYIPCVRADRSLEPLCRQDR